MNNLGLSYADLGRHADAVRLHEHTLARMKAQLGPDHPDTFASMNNLANSYTALGRHADACPLYQETLALRKAKLGPDHPDTLKSMNNLAYIYCALGRHTDTLRLHEEALARMKAKLGPDHPDTLLGMGNVAQSLVNLDRGAEAVCLIDDCVRRAAGKAVHPRLLPGVMQMRLRVYEKAKDVAGCRQTAEMWDSFNRTDAASQYDAACMWAVTAAVLHGTDLKSVQPTEPADLAMARLTQAVAAGYKDAAHIAQDRDLDALRDRADFRKLVTMLGDSRDLTRN
jgi:hypothetical protein